MAPCGSTKIRFSNPPDVNATWITSDLLNMTILRLQCPNHIHSVRKNAEHAVHFYFAMPKCSTVNCYSATWCFQKFANAKWPFCAGQKTNNSFWPANFVFVQLKHFFSQKIYRFIDWKQFFGLKRDAYYPSW